VRILGSDTCFPAINFSYLVNSQFQSNGLCQTHCQGSYAFAVLQGYDCWCSNYVPTPQQNTLDCNQVCPGFGSEWCGSTDAGLFGYFLLSQGVPLGTSGSGSSLPSPTPTSSSTSSVSIDTSTSASASGFTTGSTTSHSHISWPVYSSSSVVTPGLYQSSVEASIVTSSSETSMVSTVREPSH
jgi:cell wall integrity and stress response component